MQDIFGHLEMEHESVAALFEEIFATDSEDVQLRLDLYEELQEKLLTHSRGEERTFYIRLQNEPELSDLVQEALKEHKEMEELLDALVEIDNTSPSWMETMNQLHSVVEAHVEKEEDEIFPRARRVLGEHEAAQLSQDMGTIEEHYRSA
ncbi:MAG: hemerythrin domain-containing protein [Oligoflexus sp.]